MSNREKPPCVFRMKHKASAVRKARCSVLGLPLVHLLLLLLLELLLLKLVNVLLLVFHEPLAVDELADLGARAHALVLGDEGRECEEQHDANEVAGKGAVRARDGPLLPWLVPVQRDDNSACPRTHNRGQCRQTHKPLGPLGRHTALLRSEHGCLEQQT